ncbi:unnamed protein product [Timema podura]|uniref:Folate receptor-like domain-containing protein n=1 Tax=Timema podura TaxID=61482 RepID=A0ABN7PIN9_TIMPD|nr:unnamed protein product [Timema podura]
MYFQCVPWRDRSCCTFNTTHLTHHGSPYNFNFNHCGHVKNMSEECRKHFIQDSCFYECSPNVGPWVVKVEMKIRNERFVHVPLCSSDCEAWFEACIDDYTCTDNWVQNFKWAGGTNQCHPGSECRTFRETFETAENFCHKCTTALDCVPSHLTTSHSQLIIGPRQSVWRVVEHLGVNNLMVGVEDVVD